MKAKHVVKKLYELYKAADDKDIEFSIKVSDGSGGKLYLPKIPKISSGLNSRTVKSASLSTFRHDHGSIV